MDVVSADQAFRGLPGTGKTTTLLQVMERELESGVPIDEIAVTTYRKLMAEEFLDRAEETVGEEPDDHLIRTTHAICYRLLDLESEQVCDDHKRAKFCDDFGVEFNPAVRRPGTKRSAPLGNELFTVIDYSRNTLRDPTEAYRFCPTLSQDGRQKIGQSRGGILARFYDEYEAWKDESGLYDFTDMLAEVADRGLTPDTTVLIEDEFQDKSPLQIRVYNEWSSDTPRVYLAGDSYQSIYAFQGTSPRYMEKALDISRRDVTLDTSYRFGQSCWHYATGILESAGYEVPDIDPVGETDVKEIQFGEYPRRAAEHNDEEAYHLVRANYQKREIGDALIDAGVIFNGSGGYGWTPDMRLTYNAVSKLRSELESRGPVDWDRIEPFEEEQLAQTLPASSLSARRGHVVHDVVSASSSIHRFIDADAVRADLLNGNPMRAIISDHFDHAKEKKLLAQTWADRQGEPIEEIKHTLSTIHGSKGQEATHVFLHDLTTPNTKPPAADQGEARVYFVGATRAEEHLWIVRHGSMSAAGLPSPGVTRLSDF